MLVGSKNDGWVAPWQSQFFGQYAPGCLLSDPDCVIQSYKEREEYTRDFFGLKKLDEEGKVFVIESGLEHEEYVLEKGFFVENVVPHLY